MIKSKAAYAFYFSFLMVTMACSSVTTIFQGSVGTSGTPASPEGTPSVLDAADPQTTTTAPTQTSAEVGAEPMPVEILEFEVFNTDGFNPYIAMKIRNPNPEITLVESDLEVFLRDEEGEETDIRVFYDRISHLLPQETIGYVGLIDTEMSGRPGAPLDVSEDELFAVVEHQEYLETRYAEPFLISNEVLLEDETYETLRLSAVIENPSDNYASLSATAILYDEEDNVIGGKTHRSAAHILPEATTGVMVDLDTEEPPDRFEIFVWPDRVAPCLFKADCSESAMSKQPVVVDSGFSQEEGILTYGFVVDNPNGDDALERIVYRLTAFAEDGTVLFAGPGGIGCPLPPGEGKGIGAIAQIEGTWSVDRLDIVVYPEERVEPPPPPSYEIGNVSHSVGSLDIPMLEMSITTSGDQNREATIGVITYDDAGEISGGSTLFLFDLAPNQENLVEKPFWIEGNPEIGSVDFFPLAGCE